ncbi:DUF5320 domain-containing protein [Chloroflexota bacterium]
MPGFDGTGPRGMGPMTGGGRGYCAVPSADSSGRDLDALKTQAQVLRRQLEQIEASIVEQEKTGGKIGGNSES